VVSYSFDVKNLFIKAFLFLAERKVFQNEILLFKFHSRTIICLLLPNFLKIICLYMDMYKYLKENHSYSHDNDVLNQIYKIMLSFFGLAQGYQNNTNNISIESWFLFPNFGNFSYIYLHYNKKDKMIYHNFDVVNSNTKSFWFLVE